MRGVGGLKIERIQDNGDGRQLIYTIKDLPKGDELKLVVPLGVEVFAAGNVVLVEKLKEESFK